MTLKVDWLRGCATALVTPFTSEGVTSSTASATSTTGRATPAAPATTAAAPPRARWPSSDPIRKQLLGYALNANGATDSTLTCPSLTARFSSK